MFCHGVLSLWACSWCTLLAHTTCLLTKAQVSLHSLLGHVVCKPVLCAAACVWFLQPQAHGRAAVFDRKPQTHRSGHSRNCWKVKDHFPSFFLDAFLCCREPSFSVHMARSLDASRAMLLTPSLEHDLFLLRWQHFDRLSECHEVQSDHRIR